MEEYGEEGVEDLKAIAGRMSKLKNEVQTNKHVIALEDDGSDTAIWNQYLDEETAKHREAPCWFKSAWLYVECYMYRRIKEAVHLSKLLKTLDVFCDQKRHGFVSSQASIITLVEHLKEVIPTLQWAEKNREVFQQYLEVCLWGNKCDLSISAGSENFQKTSPIQQLAMLKPHILRDDTEKLWEKLTTAQKANPGKVRLDIVLDNAGFELVTDLCLAEVLIAMGLVNTVHFHGKTMPWFVSDVTTDDWEWTVEQFHASNNATMSEFGRKWRKYLTDKTWVYKVHDFWCLPFDYSEMRMRSADLYKDLAQADAILLKGDLNYRKLVGDLNWDPATPFDTALRGFHPAPLCSLRALKADVVVGLKPEQAKEVESQDPKWMTNGNWSVICYSGLREA
ncbi:damage-control phosphatase ARMT1-like [Liolophura sinensis]|uniref:damage-control phosphatase ARMT1-like n=1 Tax=Liolophura sinensis TaxID=3198878 RepID=UPI00315809DF